MNSVPLTGSPPMPTAGRLAEARIGRLLDRLVGEVPERETMPTLPALKMLAGMMPILQALGVSTPGQLGPMRRDLEPSSARLP
jgi:hypothetical protein